MNKNTTIEQPKTVMLAESPDGLAMTVNYVATIRYPAGAYAQISYGICSEMSVLLSNPDDPVASLFAYADDEFARARQIMRRAMRVRNAAWKLSQGRSAGLHASQV